MYSKNTNTLTGFMIACLFLLFISCESKKSSDTEGEEETTEAVEDDETMEAKDDAPIASPRKSDKGNIGTAVVKVDYGSPAVKERKIWGGLEEYGIVWRAGANETTSVEFSEDVMVAGNEVAAGKYGLYMIPNEGADWVVILNTDWDREKHGSWGAYNYTKDHDVLRVKIAPEWVDENQERLAYGVTETGIDFAWEKARLTIPVTNAGSTE